jgi:hypothetical protein
VDAVQYISTDRTIKLAHEVARPSFRIVTWKVKIVSKNFTIWIALTDNRRNKRFCRMISHCRLSAVDCTPAHSRTDVTQRLVSQSVQSKGRQDGIGAWHQCYQTLRHTESQSLWEWGAGGSRGSDF